MPDFAPQTETATPVPADAPHGGHHVARALRAAGVDTIFTLCGGHILPLLDACPEAGIRVIDHRHEGSAALAAEGYALATGRVGVAAVTAGARLHERGHGARRRRPWSVPLVLCGGHAPIAQANRAAVQDAPQLAIAGAVAKKVLCVYETAKLGRSTAEALYRARAGRPGPVYLELPQDVLAARAAWPEPAIAYGYPAEVPTPAGAAEDLEAALAELERAERPLILVGSGAFWSGAGEEIARFAELSKTPVTTTSAARGVVPDSHPWCLGTLVHAGVALLSRRRRARARQRVQRQHLLREPAALQGGPARDPGRPRGRRARRRPAARPRRGGRRAARDGGPRARLAQGGAGPRRVARAGEEPDALPAQHVGRADREARGRARARGRGGARDRGVRARAVRRRGHVRRRRRRRARLVARVLLRGGAGPDALDDDRARHARRRHAVRDRRAGGAAGRAGAALRRRRRLRVQRDGVRDRSARSSSRSWSWCRTTTDGAT